MTLLNNTDFDNNIFIRVQADDRNALNKLFEKYYSVLCNYANSIISDFDIAQEIVADVFANIWLKRNNIKINISIKSYLYASTKNASLRWLKSRKPITVSGNSEQFKMIEYESNPEKKLILKENNEIINKLLEKIPPRSREVFILHRLNNIKYKEIAIIMNISIKTVENHMGKALKIIHENASQLKNLMK